MTKFVWLKSESYRRGTNVFQFLPLLMLVKSFTGLVSVATVMFTTRSAGRVRSA